MFGFALHACRHAPEAGDADFAALRARGFDDDDVWDIGAITALFGLGNRMANLSAMRPNDPFYPLGRVPREEKRGRGQDKSASAAESKGRQRSVTPFRRAACSEGDGRHAQGPWP